MAVATLLHFGRAAEELKIGQPTLSELVQRLELEVGTPLLTRATRPVHLTEAGAEFLVRARSLLEDAAEAVTVVLERDATVLLYTDGLVERRGCDLDEGTSRLVGLIGDLSARGADLDELCDGLLRGTVEDRSDDDVAIIAVRLHSQHRLRPAEAGPDGCLLRSGRTGGVVGH